LPFLCISCQINSHTFSVILLPQGPRDPQEFSIFVIWIIPYLPVAELPDLVGYWLRFSISKPILNNNKNKQSFVTNFSLQIDIQASNLSLIFEAALQALKLAAIHYF